MKAKTRWFIFIALILIIAALFGGIYIGRLLESRERAEHEVTVTVLENGDPSESVVTATPTVEPTATSAPMVEDYRTGSDELNPPDKQSSTEPTATSTPAPTATVTPTSTSTPTPTVTPKPTATATPKPTATATPKPTATSTPAPTATATPTSKPTSTPSATPVVEDYRTGSDELDPSDKQSSTYYGKLSVKGTKLVDKNGDEVRLRGVSTHGLAWFPEYVNKKAFQSLRDDFKANCVRLAMYTAEYGGYCSGGDKDKLKKLIDDGVSYATDLGMYVIVDWHILSDSDPNTNKAEALKFFDEMSKKYSDHENVLYEICNEPNGGTNWASIKKYAEEVIPVIRKNDKDAIIIVGTPTWSQEVDKAAADPIKGYDNIMYTIHFYAATHKDSLRTTMKNAVKKGIAIFCTEFGTCDASGNGSNDFNESEKWIKAMEEAGVSYCIWNLSNKSETSALIKSGNKKTSGWTESDLSDSGKWYMKLLNGGTLPALSGGDTEGTENNSNSESGTNSGDPETQKPSETVTGTVGNLSATVSESGGWNDGKSYFTQYTIKLENKGSSDVTDWTVTLSFTGKTSVSQSWNGSFSSSSDTTVVVKPSDHNGTISPGSSQELGFIVSKEQENCIISEIKVK